MNLFELSAKISIDDSDFKKSMENAQKVSKNVAKAMEELQSPLDKVKSRFNAIAHPIETAKKGFEDLKNKVESVRHPIETFKAKVQESSTAIETQRNKLSVLAAGYDSAQKKVDELTKEFNASAKESGTSSKKTQELAEKLKDAENEASSAKKEMDDFAKSVSEAGKNSGSAKDKIAGLVGGLGKVASGLGTAVATAAKVGAVAVGAAATGIAALTKSAVENYAEYEQLVGGVETLFGTSAGKVQEYASNAYKTAGLSANEYMETVTSFSASLLQSLGGDTEAAAEYADRAVTDMSDNANKMGTSMEMIQNAYQGFAKQNYTMLDNLKLGYGGTKEEMERLVADAAALTDVQADLGVTVDANSLSFGNIVNAISVMQTKMGIAGTTTEEASETISGSINVMKGAWSNLITGIADENANFEELVNNFVETLVGDDSGEGGVINNILPRVEVALEGAGKLVEALIPVIIDKVPTIINEWLPKILQSGVNIIQSIMNGMIQNQGDIVNGVVNTVNTLVNGLLDHLPEILVMGVTLIGQIAAGLIQGLPELMAKIPEIIFDIVDAFASNGDVFLEIGKSIVSGIWNGIVSLWNSLVSELSGLVNSLFGGSTATANVNVNGSHAGGLEYVPFDGYIAELHKGERVLTASEARGYNNRSNSGYDERPIKIVVQSVLDGKVIGETAYNYNRRKARAGGT